MVLEKEELTFFLSDNNVCFQAGIFFLRIPLNCFKMHCRSLNARKAITLFTIYLLGLAKLQNKNICTILIFINNIYTDLHFSLEIQPIVLRRSIGVHETYNDSYRP